MWSAQQECMSGWWWSFKVLICNAVLPSHLAQSLQAMLTYLWAVKKTQKTQNQRWAIWKFWMENFPRFWGFLTFPSGQNPVRMRQEMVTDLAALSQSKRARGRWGSILYLPLSGWDCRPDLASMYWYISRSTSKGPLSPKGSRIVPLEKQKPDSFSASPFNSPFFTPTSVPFVLILDERQVKWCFPLRAGEAGGAWWSRMQPRICLLAGVFTCRLQGRNISLCLLQMMVAHWSKLMIWERSFECCQVRGEGRNLMGGYFICSLLYALVLQR